jgi:predicted RNA-binding Zn-ribbon protein involved in translation (DUF1610 family)
MLQLNRARFRIGVRRAVSFAQPAIKTSTAAYPPMKISKSPREACPAGAASPPTDQIAKTANSNIRDTAWSVSPLPCLFQADDADSRGIVEIVARRSVEILALISVILSLATAAMWLRSQQTCDFLWNGGPNGEAGMFFSNRAVCFYFERIYMGPRLKPPYGWGHETRPAISQYWPRTVVFFLGWSSFCIVSGNDARTRQFLLALPYWFVLLGLLALPSAWVIYCLRLRRNVPDSGVPICASCGYDLRATPDACPECGTVPNRVDVSRRRFPGLRFRLIFFNRRV